MPGINASGMRTSGYFRHVAPAIYCRHRKYLACGIQGVKEL